MATVRTVTARFLGGYKSPHTRVRYKKDIMMWQRFCSEHGIHPLDCRTVNGQMFVDWMAGRLTPGSVRARLYGVSQWFDALCRARIVSSNGLRGAKTAKVPNTAVSACDLSEDDIALIMGEASKLGPRWEWLMGMVVYAGCDAAEALRVRGMDVRAWHGKTFVRVKSRREQWRDIPVDGRLEVLTIGLSQVFAASSPLGGSVQSNYVSSRLSKVASKGLGRPVNVMDMRRFAVVRQYRRGVTPEVISRWLGHTSDRWVRRTIGLSDPVASVSIEDVARFIVVEPDGARFGSGSGPDSLILDVP